MTRLVYDCTDNMGRTLTTVSYTEALAFIHDYGGVINRRYEEVKPENKEDKTAK